MPWGCYWNLTRTNDLGKVGSEGGGSFYLSKYGIRIINSSNMFVAGRIDEPHGAGVYHSNTHHVGISMLIGKDLSKQWRKDGEKVLVKT